MQTNHNLSPSGNQKISCRPRHHAAAAFPARARATETPYDGVGRRRQLRRSPAAGRATVESSHRNRPVMIRTVNRGAGAAVSGAQTTRVKGSGLSATETDMAGGLSFFQPRS